MAALFRKDALDLPGSLGLLAPAYTAWAGDFLHDLSGPEASSLWSGESLGWVSRSSTHSTGRGGKDYMWLCFQLCAGLREQFLPLCHHETAWCLAPARWSVQPHVC